MRPSTHQPISTERLASANTSDVQTATIPNGTSAILITVETNPAKLTFGAAGNPASATSAGHVIQKDQQPWHMLLGQGAVIKVCSTVGASVVQLTYLQ